MLTAAYGRLPIHLPCDCQQRTASSCASPPADGGNSVGSGLSPVLKVRLIYKYLPAGKALRNSISDILHQDHRPVHMHRQIWHVHEPYSRDVPCLPVLYRYTYKRCNRRTACNGLPDICAPIYSLSAGKNTCRRF